MDQDDEQYDVNNEDLAHLAGVFDGGGSITANIGKDDNYAVGYRFIPLISISRPKDDLAMLGKIDAFCDEYGVQYHTRETDSSTVISVTSPDSIMRLTDELLPWIVSLHDSAILMRDKVLPLLEETDVQSRETFYELVGYADELRKRSRHGPPSKYTQSYFADEWNISTETP